MSWLDWAQLAYGIYRDQNPRSPEFKEVPLSPEQQQVYQIYINSLLDPSTRDNSARLNQMATQMLGGMSGMQWQSPRTFSGDVGYGGSRMSYTPPQSGPMGGTWPTTGGGANTPPPLWTDSDNPDFGRGFEPDYRDARTVGGYVYGGPFNPDYAPGGVGTGPNTATPTTMEDMMDLFKRAAGPWDRNAETYEKWASRAASMVGGMFGIPIPAGLIDKGIDAAQWLYGKFSNRGTQPLPAPTQSFGDVARNAPGTEYVAPMPKPTQSFGDVAKNAPGTRDQYGNPPAPPYSGYQVNPRTGDVTRENNPFNYGGYAGGANEQYTNDWWRNLQSGPGYPWASGGTGDAGTGVKVQNARGRGGRGGRV